MMYAGRLLIGIASGASSVPVSLYCEEIATVQIRGKIGTYLDLLITVGLLIAYALGAVLPYFWFTAMGLIPVVVFALGFYWMPESPAYLITCGREEEAHKALSWLRGPAIDVRPEFDEIKIAFKTKETHNVEGCFTIPKIDKVTAKAVLIVIGIMFLTQTTGLHGFLYYSTDVFREVGSSISADLSTIIVGSMHVVGAVIVLLSVDRLGRRPMLLGASFLMGLCLSALSLYSYMQDQGDIGVGHWRWVPLITLLVYYFLFSLGPGPLSWFMMAEILPPHAKGWGSALGVCVTRGVSFLITKEFETASEAWGNVVVCGAFSILCFVFTAFIWIFVPETRGRKRQEIQEALREPVFKRWHLSGVTLTSVRRLPV